MSGTRNTNSLWPTSLAGGTRSFDPLHITVYSRLTLEAAA